MHKNKEIVLLRRSQDAIKKEISGIKKKIPTFIVAFILFSIIALYFIEDKYHAYFGNGVHLLFFGLILLGIVFLFIVYKIYHKIEKKEKESKIIGTKLYNIMKLEEESNNEQKKYTTSTN